MKKNILNDLVKKVQTGDPSAFEQLYNEFGKRVYFTALKITGSTADAEDILQDTFLTALEKIGDLKAPENFGAWVTRISVNKCNKLMKKSFLTDEDEEVLENFADDEEFIPDNYADDKAKRKIVMDIIDNVLTPLQRQTVILFYFDGMSTVDIAQISNCTPEAVRVRLNAARAKIKEAVLIYEKKNDDRLHVVAPIPVLTSILKKEADKTVLPKTWSEFGGKAAEDLHKNLSDKNNLNGGKNTLGKVKTKIIAAVVTLVIIGGGVTAGVLLNGKNTDTDKGSSVSVNKEVKGSNKKSSEKAEGSAEIEKDAKVAQNLSGDITKCEKLGEVNDPLDWVMWDKIYDPDKQKVYFDYNNSQDFLNDYEVTQDGQVKNINHGNFANYKDGGRSLDKELQPGNVIYVDSRKNHSVEFEDTQDVYYAFLADNRTDLICVADKNVKAFDITSGEKKWQADVQVKASNIVDKYIVIDSSYTDRKTLVCANNDVVNLEDGSVRKVHLSGKYQYNTSEGKFIEINSSIKFSPNGENFYSTRPYLIADKNGRNVICRITLDKKENQHVVNRVSSMYGKREIANFITMAINENRIKAINKEKAESLLRSIGCQSPKEETTISFDNGIAYTTANVKYPQENLRENTQFHEPIPHDKLIPVLNAKSEWQESKLETLKEKRTTRDNRQNDIFFAINNKDKKYIVYKMK